MICYCVLFHCSLVGVFSSAVDAAQCAKGLHGSTVVQCRLNDYTDTGKEIVRNPAYIPRRAQEWLLSGPPGGDARQYAAMLGAQLAAHYRA